MGFTTESHPGVSLEPPANTDGFALNHSMLRVKDLKIALDFYTRVLGMHVLFKHDFPDMKFHFTFCRWAGLPKARLPMQVGAARGHLLKPAS